MKVISLIFPTVKCHGEAKIVLGDEVKGNGETKAFNELPKVDGDKVYNMPEPCGKECYFLCNIYVFTALKDKRDDLIAFDEAYTTRDEQGKVISQGGVTFSG